MGAQGICFAVAANTVDDLIRTLTGEKIGRSVALDVLRGTELLTISLVPQERKWPR
jgi:S1-C subfamily serine protease